MAFTTTANHSQTATDIITEALELLGVLAEGESPGTDQTTSSLRTLNNMIKLWSADTQIYAQNEYTLDLVASTNTYTLGVSNVGYIPNKIINATLIDTTTNQEIPINPLTQEEWYSLTDKTTEARVTQYYFKRNPVGVDSDFYVWPTPADTTYDLNLWLQYPLRDVTVGTDDVYFTQEWYLALSYGLAYLLAPKYGIHPAERDRLKGAMDEMRWEASTYDIDGSVYFQPNNNFRGGWD